MRTESAPRQCLDPGLWSTRGTGRARE